MQLNGHFVVQCKACSPRKWLPSKLEIQGLSSKGGDGKCHLDEVK